MSALAIETSESDEGGDPFGVLFNLALRARFLRKRLTSRASSTMARTRLTGRIIATARSFVELVEKLVYKLQR